MKIRRPTVNDASTIAQVQVKAWQTAYRHLLPHDLLDNLSIETRREFWTHQIEQNEWHIFVSEAEGRLVGFTAFGPCRDTVFDSSTTWELYTLYILPRVWGQGHGTALWQAVVNHARSHFISGLYLWVFQDNIPSRRFYEHRGMKHDPDMTKLKEREGIAIPEVRYYMEITDPKLRA